MVSSRRLTLLITALVVFSSSAILFEGKTYAQSLEILPLKQNEQIIQQNNQKLSQKTVKLDSTSQKVYDLQTKKKVLAQQLEDNKKAIEDLRQKIAEKKAAEEKAAIEAAKAAEVKVVSTPVAQGPVGNCGDNYYASYIYGMESGGRVVGNCNPSAKNAGGCLGIGQACPGSKLIAACPGLDYTCQNAYFTNYAVSRYGDWAGAYNFWIGNGWW